MSLSGARDLLAEKFGRGIEEEATLEYVSEWDTPQDHFDDVATRLEYIIANPNETDRDHAGLVVMLDKDSQVEIVFSGNIENERLANREITLIFSEKVDSDDEVLFQPTSILYFSEQDVDDTGKLVVLSEIDQRLRVIEFNNEVVHEELQPFVPDVQIPELVMKSGSDSMWDNASVDVQQITGNRGGIAQGSISATRDYGTVSRSWNNFPVNYLRLAAHNDLFKELPHDDRFWDLLTPSELASIQSFIDFMSSDLESLMLVEGEVVIGDHEHQSRAKLVVKIIGTAATVGAIGALGAVLWKKRK